MHVGRRFGAVGDDFIVGVTMDDGFHLGLVGGALTAETNPNGERVGELADGRVVSTCGALGVIIVVLAHGRHAASIHATVGEVAVS